MKTFYSLRVQEQVAKELLVAESSDHLGIRRDGSTTYDKVTEAYREHLRRKAEYIMKAMDDR